MNLECWFYVFRGIYHHLIQAQEQKNSRFVQNVKLAKPTFSTWHSRELKMETFSGRRQLQPDVTSWFVQYCACSCSPHETGLFGVVARTWVFNFHFNQVCCIYLATRILQIIVLKLSLFSLSHISSSISKLCYLNLHLYNVSMFHVTESRSNLIQYGKQQTVSELYMDKIVLRAKWKYPDKKYELRYFNCVFLAHFFR